MPKLKAILLTGRTIEQGTAKEQGKFSEEYQKSVTICEVDPNDMKRLGVGENDNIKISTDSGSIVMRAVKSARTPHPAMIFIPYGPWVNILMNSETAGTGMPLLKGVPAEIQPATGDRILSLSELLEEHFRKV